MATAADVHAFRAKFMELSSLSDPQIAAGLNLADVMLGSGSNWQSQRDFAEARMQYAAHQAIMQQMAMSAAGDGSGLSDLYVQSIRFGERTVTFGRRENVGSDNAASVGEAMLETTTAGQLFLELRARNIVPVGLV
jgi:Protein of unknown function (DUF4054)